MQKTETLVCYCHKVHPYILLNSVLSQSVSIVRSRTKATELVSAHCSQLLILERFEKNEHCSECVPYTEKIIVIILLAVCVCVCVVCVCVCCVCVCVVYVCVSVCVVYVCV
jgi:hypothetical protein